MIYKPFGKEDVPLLLLFSLDVSRISCSGAHNAACYCSKEKHNVLYHSDRIVDTFRLSHFMFI
jgi:hypothetical protein